MSPFHSKTMHRVSISSSCFPPKREPVSTVKKNSAILKKATTERHTGWSRKEWHSNPKHQCRSSAHEDAGQSSHDKWKSSRPQGKWKEVSLEVDALGSALKEKTHTLNKSCKESARRETKLYKMIEIAAKDEKQEDKQRSITKKTFTQLGKEEDEADEARALRRTCSTTWTRQKQKSTPLDVVFIVKSTSTCTRGDGRPHYIMDKSVGDDAK